MKSLMIVIVAMCLSSVVQAQDAPAPDPRVAELQEANKNLIARLSKLEQQAATPDPKAQAKKLRDGYRSNCTNRGLRLKEVQIDGATGKLTLICH